MSANPAIPVIDVAALFGAPTAARERADRAVMSAAALSGFFVARGFPPGFPIDRRSTRGSAARVSTARSRHSGVMAPEVRCVACECLSRMVSIAKGISHQQGRHRSRT